MKKHLLIATVVLAATALLTVVLEREAPVKTRGHSFARRIPLKLGRWRGKELPVPKAVIDALETDDVLMRAYTKDTGEKIVFAAVFAMDNRRAAHPPEICYRGQGWSVEGKTNARHRVRPPANGYVPLDIDENGELVREKLDELTSFADPVDFTFTELILRHAGGKRQVVHYWYKTGRRSTNSRIRHEIHMLLNNIFHRESSNSLLRVSAEARSSAVEDIQAARAAVEDFSVEVFPYTLAAMP